MTNIIKQNQQSEWLDVIKCEVQFFLHQPSGKCGIHIRGLATMCGVDDKSIRYLLDLRNNSDFFKSRYLKNKEIYLTDLRKNHPIKNGKAVKVVEASVCAEVIHYYAEQKREKAVESALAFMRFGIEQYIYAQVGYIPTPASMLIDEIEFLFAEEPVQVTKSQTKSVLYVTNPRTGECGIELQGVASLCGGVALKQVKQFLDQTDAPFLLQNQQRVIVKAAACTASFDYFANHSKPRKSLAKLSLVNLDPIVPKIHAKTHYQNPHTEREVILQAENEQLKKEVEHLRQLTHQTRGKDNMDWHDFFGRFLKKALEQKPYTVEVEKLVAKQDQYLDCLVISHTAANKSANVVPVFADGATLPDGLELNKTYNLVSYKSCRESLTMWSIQELIGYYTGYRKDLRTEQDNQLPDEQLFQLYAVTTHYPKTVAEQAHTWKTTDKSGVYWLQVAGLWIQVIVTAQIAVAAHNVLWNLLSDNVEAVKFGLQFVDADLPELQQIKEYYQL